MSPLSVFRFFWYHQGRSELLSQKGSRMSSNEIPDESDQNGPSGNALTIGHVVILCLIVVLCAMAGTAAFLFSSGRLGDVLPLEQRQAACVSGGGEVVFSSGIISDSYMCRTSDGLVEKLPTRQTTEKEDGK